MNRKANFFSRLSILNPEKVAPIVVEKMLKGKEVIIPGAVNRFSLVLDKLLPSFLKRIFTARLMKTLKPPFYMKKDRVFRTTPPGNAVISERIVRLYYGIDEEKN